MAEEYAGTKFKTVLAKARLKPSKKVGELIGWCKEFKARGLAPDYKTASGKTASAGNLSFRTSRGFVVTPAGKNVARLRAGDLIEVTRIDLKKQIVFARGLAEPSSEALMHYLVYAARRDANAVFHGHSREILAEAKNLGLPVTAKKAPYGTLALARQAATALRKKDFVVLRGHGFAAVGKTMARAGGLAFGVQEKALKLARSKN